ncbi:FAD-binding oxidoreductase [Actinomadura luteofluorescens]|uniref:FAD-binding oxidoreductase n=1 Tax=Actinomadura luteofluorescens TaxID=46163 RepID=UPI0036422F1C
MVAWHRPADRERAGLLGDRRISRLRGPMARAAVPGRLTWRVARLAETRRETDTARTLVFDVPGWPGHLAGQHVDVRLTAADGYTAQRSYSLSAPDRVELTVQRIADGEVSPYLTDVLGIGDPVELRGPVGGWFVWRPDAGRDVLLIAGGSGVAPLMAMVRARRLAEQWRAVPAGVLHAHARGRVLRRRASASRARPGCRACLHPGGARGLAPPARPS